MLMEHLLSTLVEFYEPNCVNERRMALQTSLITAQQTLSCEHMASILKYESPVLRRFLFQTICIRPLDFLSSLEVLVTWYIKDERKNLEETKSAAMALASMLIESGPDKLNETINRCQTANPAIFCLLAGGVAARLQLGLATSNVGKARCFPYQQLLSQHMTDYLTMSEGSLEVLEANATREVIQVCPKLQTAALLNALFVKASKGFRSAMEWVDLLNTCIEACPFDTIAEHYMAILQSEPDMVTAILAGLQDNMENFCTSTSRQPFCKYLIECLATCPVEVVQQSIGFWEDLSCDLSDSDLVGVDERLLFKAFFEIAATNALPKEYMETVVKLSYKVLDEELVNVCIDGYVSHKDHRFIDILTFLGSEYVGNLTQIQALLNHLKDRNPKLFVDIVHSFHPSILRNSLFAGSCCITLKSYLANQGLLDAVIECLYLYSDYITDDIILECTNILSEMDVSLATKVSRLCAKACINRKPSFNSGVLEAMCRNEHRISPIVEFLRNKRFEFDPEVVPSLSVKICAILNNYDGESDEEFIALSISQIASFSPKLCESLLNQAELKENAFMVFLSAEKIRHFDRCFEMLCVGLERGIFHESFTRLFSQVLLKSFGMVMEFGIERVILMMDICIMRLRLPVDINELDSILEFFKVFFVHKSLDCEENWRTYLLQLKHKDILDSLLQASYTLNRELNNRVAAFYCLVNQESPVYIRDWVQSSSLRERLAWMPKCVNMNDFTMQYQQLFK